MEEFPQYFAQEWESIPATRPTEPEKNSTCFDCSICLDFARDPVVTLCGHLYCWPCIYKWIDSQDSLDETPQCPICKAQISKITIVPLYGRGKSFSDSETESKVIPPRPSATSIKALMSLLNPEQPFTPTYHHHHHHHRIQNRHSFSNNFSNYGEYSLSPLSINGTAALSHFHPTAGVFWEMIYARVFGNSQSMYSYPDLHRSVGNRSARLRRRELQVEESLNRVTIFLFCFFLLCLFVF